MGLFGSKKTLGNMRLDFSSHDELSVKDGIPDGGDVPYPLLFAYLFTGNVLAQYPGDRKKLVSDAASRLAGRVDSSDPLAWNDSLLGTFSEEPPKLFDAHEGGSHWVCEGTLTQKGDEALVDARIASGFGDSFHTASIDAVLETVRQRLGDRGGAICDATLSFLQELSGEDCSDPASNCAKAREAALRAARTAGLAS
jgi:hypothetical protein